MTDDSNHIDYLIARNLSGEASAEERERLRLWRLESNEHEEYFDELKLIFDRAALLEADTQFDADAAWNKVVPLLHKSKTVNFRARPWAIWTSVAASIAILIGLWFSHLNNDTTIRSKQATTLAAAGTDKQALLPDSTKVEIESNSHITYAEGFGKTNREVTLEGNASFEVKHQSGPAFTVRTCGTFIKDIGTAFRIETKKDTSVVEVYVKTGVVVFYTSSSKGVVLRQGETGIYNKRTKSFTKKEAAKDEAPPITVRAFNFQETPLSKVVEVLGKAYNVRIALSNPKLGSCTISVRFENEDINTILDIVAETLSLKLDKQEKGYLLIGEECSK